MSRKNKLLLISIAILLVCAVIVGFSYAYWRLNYQAKYVNKIVSSCFSMELANEKNNITLDSAYPISDEKGKALTPYSFTITNTCDLFASYSINLEMLEGTTLSSKYIKSMINNEEIINLATLESVDTTIEGATESRELFKGSLGSGDSEEYTLRVWMDSETPATGDSMNKVFQAKVTVIAEVSTYSPVENGFTNLADALLVNEYQTTDLNIAKNRIDNKQTVNFMKTAPIIDWMSVTSPNTTVLSVNKLHKDVVGGYGLSAEFSQIVFGTSYDFDKTSGMYIFTDGAFYDPETLDFSSNTYYMCGSSAVDSLLYTGDETCPTNHIYKINSFVSATDKWIENGSIAVTEYTFRVQNVNPSEVESDTSDKGIYKTQDESGYTYYYRGNVNNNYVKFADNYWKVLRVNGDGSIRLLYAGSAINGEQHIGLSFYSSSIDNPTYVGYMYSNTLNTSYVNTIKNDNDSTIKTVLDSWYKTNILEKGYNDYVADSGFCNDRTLYAGSPGNGYLTNNTSIYASYARFLGYSPSYVCSNASNDLFTLAGNTKGNGALTYPIGLITLDDLVYAGVVNGYVNKKVFTYTESPYWTMTPLFYDPSYSSAFMFNTLEGGTVGYSTVASNYGVRPVINLKADTEITGGIGTKNDPFIIK